MPFPSTYTQYSITINIPNVNCERCSLHLSNPMTDKIGNDGAPSGIGCTDPGSCFSVYHSCTIPFKIVGDAGAVERADYTCPDLEDYNKDWPTVWEGDNMQDVDASTPGVYRRESSDWDSEYNTLATAPAQYREAAGGLCSGGEPPVAQVSNTPDPTKQPTNSPTLVTPNPTTKQPTDAPIALLVTTDSPSKQPTPKPATESPSMLPVTNQPTTNPTTIIIGAGSVTSSPSVSGTIQSTALIETSTTSPATSDEQTTASTTTSPTSPSDPLTVSAASTEPQSLISAAAQSKYVNKSYLLALCIIARMLLL